VFDKTGTITEGKPAVTDFLPAARRADEARSWRWSPAPKRLGTLPGARHQRLVPRARRVPAPTLDFIASPGRGVRAAWRRQAILIGNAALLDAAGIDCSASRSRPGLGRAGQDAGVCRRRRQSASPVRHRRPGAPGAKEAIALLHRLGLKTVMATGDVEAVANHIARRSASTASSRAPRRPTSWTDPRAAGEGRNASA
jgi:Cu+-exporting ATPase